MSQPATAPRVTVLIPARNAAGFLPEALESVRLQTLQDLEVLVVDDGSTDATAEVARAGGSRVRLLQLEHGGVSRARNHGMRNARGLFIVFLDADDRLAPLLVERAVRFLEKDPGLGFVFSNFVLSYEDGTTSPPHYPPGAFGDAPEVIIRDALAEVIARGFAISTSGLCARRGVLEETGGFDESLVGGEDFDYWNRIYLRRPVGCLVDPLVRVRRHARGTTADPARVIPSIARSVDLVCRRLEAAGRAQGVPIARRCGRRYIRGGIMTLLGQGRTQEARRFLLTFKDLLAGPRWFAALALSLIPAGVLRAAARLRRAHGRRSIPRLTEAPPRRI
jgi:glycosyltransferase involved in cell wall biosynthesis